MQDSVATALLGSSNPIPTAFFLENKAANGKLLPNLRFLATVVSYDFL